MTDSRDADDRSKVNIISRQTIFDDVFQIDEARLKFRRFDQTWSPEVRLLNFERGDSVAAVLYKPSTESVILVNQFRYPSHTKGHGWILELVAGTCKAGESPNDTMSREVVEDGG